MRERWRRFVHMHDRDRARLLAKICLGGVVLLLYALGGASLWVRARYLDTASPSDPVGTVVQIGLEMAAPTEWASPTATLYPTITPNLTETALAREAYTPLVSTPAPAPGGSATTAP